MTPKQFLGQGDPEKLETLGGHVVSAAVAQFSSPHIGLAFLSSGFLGVSAATAPSRQGSGGGKGGGGKGGGGSGGKIP